jgi:hypothetical protein
MNSFSQRTLQSIDVIDDVHNNCGSSQLLYITVETEALDQDVQVLGLILSMAVYFSIFCCCR